MAFREPGEVKAGIGEHSEDGPEGACLNSVNQQCVSSARVGREPALKGKCVTLTKGVRRLLALNLGGTA